MKQIRIHEDARESFNTRARELLKLAATSSRLRRRGVRREAEFSPDYHVAGRIDRGDVLGEPKAVTVDAAGRAVSRSIMIRGEQRELDEDRYRELSALVSSIRRAISRDALVSEELIEDGIVDWMQFSLRTDDAPPMMNHLLGILERDVGDHEIWVPIACLHIQSPLRIGEVVIEQLEWSAISTWLDSAGSGDPLRAEGISKFRERLSRKIRGLAVAKTRVFGDAISADAVAVQRAEEVCSILRLFHPSALIAQQKSHCTVLGRENAESRISIRVESGVCVGLVDGYLNNAPVGWHLSDSTIQAMRAMGLAGLIAICEKTSRTELESALLDSLRLYSRVTLVSDIADKLVYLLSSIESLFLKNQSEPIQQNLGERIAFLIGRELEDRRRIVAAIRSAYSLRSRSLHHGIRDVDPREVEAAMSIAWNALLSVIAVCEQASSRDEFLTRLDDMKLS